MGDMKFIHEQYERITAEKYDLIDESTQKGHCIVIPVTCGACTSNQNRYPECLKQHSGLSLTVPPTVKFTGALAEVNLLEAKP